MTSRKAPPPPPTPAPHRPFHFCVPVGHLCLLPPPPPPHTHSLLLSRPPPLPPTPLHRLFFSLGLLLRFLLVLIPGNGMKPSRPSRHKRSFLVAVRGLLSLGRDVFKRSPPGGGGGCRCLLRQQRSVGAIDLVCPRRLLFWSSQGSCGHAEMGAVRGRGAGEEIWKGGGGGSWIDKIDKGTN